MAKNLSKDSLTESLASSLASRARTRTQSSTSGAAGSIEKTNLKKLRAALVKVGTTGGDANGEAHELAIAYLATVGCSVPASTEAIAEKEYSLIGDTTDTELVENESIFDKSRFSTITNKNVSTTDKFANVDDPFYELDTGLTLREQAVRTATLSQSEPDLSQFAADLKDYMDPNTISEVVEENSIAQRTRTGASVSGLLTDPRRASARSSKRTRTRDSASGLLTQDRRIASARSSISLDKTLSRIRTLSSPGNY